MVRAVIFDVDGVLIDSVDLHASAWVEALRHFGFDLPYPTVRSQIGKGGDQLMPALLPREVVDRRGQEIEDFRGELFKRDYLPRAKAFPQVRALFERLRADGRLIGLGTSSKADDARRYRELANIDDLVDAMATGDDVAHSKPCPDIFTAALSRLRDMSRLQDMSPPAADEALVVGDSPYDAEAAVRAGIRPVGLLGGGFPEADLRDAGCIAIFQDPADLLARYDRSPLAEEAAHAR